MFSSFTNVITLAKVSARAVGCEIRPRMRWRRLPTPTTTRRLWRFGWKTVNATQEVQNGKTNSICHVVRFLKRQECGSWCLALLSPTRMRAEKYGSHWWRYN